MAILAGKIVAGETSRGVGDRRADLVRSVGEKGVPIFDESAKWIVGYAGNVGRRPLREIDVVCGM
jgi:hypothetical protein